ncbi:thiamine phosphate synthase [Hydrotalea sp.]|nr:thiamine phosphate synthase [Hydrotalea sp.]
MKLIIITTPENLPNETVMINQMFELGLERLHIRKPKAGIEDYRKYLDQINPIYHHLISVHAFPELLKDFTTIGFHCTGKIINNSTKMDFVFSNNPKIISASFHSWEELKNNNYPFDYIFISPIFNSMSKPGYTGNIAINRIQSSRLAIKMEKKFCPKIIGLGGISETNMHVLYNAGFEGVAIIGNIWLMPNAVTRFILLKNYLSNLNEGKGQNT